MRACSPQNLESPEIRLILESVAGTEEDTSRALNLIRDGVDWDVLHHLAIRERVLPLLFTLLCKIGSNDVPSALLTTLKKAFVANTSRNIVLAQRLVILLDLLKTNGVEALAYKGPALAMQAYGDLSLRTFGDLDILIRGQDLLRTYEVLNKSGFRSLLPLKPNQMRRLLQREPELHFAGKGIHIDVHWAFEDRWPAVEVPPEQLWKERESLRLEDRQIHAISGLWAMKALWVHGSRHQWDNLQLVADLVRLNRRYPELMQTLPSQEEVEGTSQLQELQLAINDPASFARKALQDRVRLRLGYRLREYVRGAFIPKQTDWMALNLPDALYGLYYVARPCRLAWKYVRKIAGSTGGQHPATTQH